MIRLARFRWLLLTVVLTLGVCQPIAAQSTNRPFAALGRYLQTDAFVVTNRESGETSGQARSPSAPRVSAPTDPPAAHIPGAVDSQAPVATLGALSSRVAPGDTVSVRVSNGEDIVGTFSRVSESSLTIMFHGQPREISAKDIQEVRRRGGNRVKQGMLFGFLTGAAVADIAMASSDSESDYSLASKMFLGTVAGGGTGLVWGAIAGAFVHKRPVVYRAAGPTVRVIPVLAPDRAAVMTLVQF